MSRRAELSAFPHGESIVGALRVEPSPGMTLRDWFAGKALAGFLASADTNAALDLATTHAPRLSYEIADAMLAARVLGVDPASSTDVTAPSIKPHPNQPRKCLQCGVADWNDCDCIPF